MAKALPKTPASQKKYASVQEEFVGMREVDDDILCLASQTTPGMYDHVAVIEVEGDNYGLRSTDAQASVIAKFRALLNGLPPGQPIQFLVRILPLNLDDFLVDETAAPQGPAVDYWRELASSYNALLRDQARDRALMQRRYYVILPARLGDELAPGLSQVVRDKVWPFGRKSRRARILAEERQKARRILAPLVHNVMRQLSKMGHSSVRLRGPALVNLYRSCLLGQQADRAPLPDAVIAGVNRPFRAKRRAGHTPREERSGGEVARASSDGYTLPEHRVGRQDKALLDSPPSPLFPQLADLVAPAGVKISESMISLMHTEPVHCTTIIFDGLPREVEDVWLAPLLNLNEPMDLSIHSQQLNKEAAIRDLRWKKTGQEAQERYALQKGGSADVATKEAEGETVGLMRKLIRGEECMHECSMYLLLRGASRQELRERIARVLPVLRTLQISFRSAYLQQDEGLRCCLPEARNPLRFYGNSFRYDGASAAAGYTFLSDSLSMPGGVFEGITPSGSPIFINRWHPSLPNAHKFVAGPSGWGKSYATQCYLDRLFLLDKHRPVIIIDPEREYAKKCVVRKGQWVRFGPGSPHRINPFDLYDPRTLSSQDKWLAMLMAGAEEDRLSLKIQFLRELLQIMLADRGPERIVFLSAAAMGLLDHALYEVYRRKGITEKVDTHRKTPPQLADLYAVLEEGVCGPDTHGLCTRLYPYVFGSHKGLFDGQTNVALDNDLVVLDAKDLGEELAPIMITLLSSFVWTITFGSDIQRDLVIDEAGVLGEYEAWARFMTELTSRARKHGLAITLHVQSTKMMGQQRMHTILNNCAIKVLMGNAPAAYREHFDLSENEEQEMTGFTKGDALVIMPHKRLVVHYLASALENRLYTTDPLEVAQIRQEETANGAYPLAAGTPLLEETGLDTPAELTSVSVPGQILRVSGGEADDAAPGKRDESNGDGPAKTRRLRSIHVP